ncbi:MAG: hypothetical protein F6K22_10205 [Okeania sp. SIO2F4]|uniref:hypothetical protein n=1 Tax=Okeania sp. SIO2F4 TaxID=2607790 RepID=UPI00142A783B|nr:hypothetical protein [Okeania sp. SIO2F4]NES03189.1 hypothetical protein [Okeania sp. SIO2F4]
MKFLFIQAIDRSNSNLFKCCATTSWLSLGKILCDGRDFAIDYGGLGLIEKIHHIFQIEWLNIRSNQLGRGRYRPKISVHNSD